MYTLKQISRKIQNYTVTKTDLENEIRRLTTTDAWGPTTKELSDFNMSILRKGSYASTEGLDFILETPLRVELLPATADLISESSKAVFHLFNRIAEYADVPMIKIIPFSKLRLFLNEEPAPLFENYGTRQIYESVKRSYVTQGLEFRIIQKTLIVLEYLLLNCVNSDTYDIEQEIKSYIQILTQLSENYVCKMAVDHKMKFHTEAIRSKSSYLVMLLQSPDELLQKRRSNNNSKRKNSGTDISDTHIGSSYQSPPGSRTTRPRNKTQNSIMLDDELDQQSGGGGGGGGIEEGVYQYNDQDLSGVYQDHDPVMDYEVSEQKKKPESKPQQQAQPAQPDLLSF